MKLTLQLRLLPTPEQHAALLDTMARFNAAATFAAHTGFAAGVFGQVSIHHLAYYAIRERFGLSSQMAVRAIAKAVECFQRDKTVCPTFKAHSAICYDQRVLRFKGLNEVSLWALPGRLHMPFVCGAYQRARQGRIQGQADLVAREGKLYLLCTINMPEEASITPNDVIGVDLGIVNLAADSTGELFSGTAVDATRQRYAGRRRILNKVGTKSARRRLAKIRKREASFRRDVNHGISKQLVLKAKGTHAALALEDLTGIRQRGTTVRKVQRSRHAGWAFRQLRSFVTYKATLAGIPVLLVDPRNTSCTCATCGYCEKANRKSQAVFVCYHCGYSTNADFNAARNIRARALVNAPMVGMLS
jgi:IS605 OrfB family transposase